jgi:hypothetical protein
MTSELRKLIVNQLALALATAYQKQNEGEADDPPPSSRSFSDNDHGEQPTGRRERDLLAITGESATRTR